MIDTIHVAMSGLQGYEQGLRTIANNTANLNTPGFKGATQQFSDLFANGGSVAGGDTASRQQGSGLRALGTTINFSQGQLQNTGNELDLAMDGDGLFTLRGGDGTLRYTRDGQFKFDANGVLVAATSGRAVMALDAGGGLGEISLSALRTHAAKATSTVVFSGNLSGTATTHTVNGVTVIDGAGTPHTLSVRLDAVTGTPNTWTVTLLDGTTTVGTGSIAFVSGKPDPAAATVAVVYAPAGQATVPLTLDFSRNVTSSGTSTTSSLAMASQNGYGPGGLTRATFDATGTLVLSYSNGQTARGPRLALGRFSSPDAIRAAGDNEFEVVDGRAWQAGVAEEQGFGSLRAGMVEISNVDLSQQFSELVIMQRGYQASSQIVSTANEMIGELFAIRK